MITPNFILEQKLSQEGYKFIAGIDEAGRGAWAGPIVAAAVILPADFPLKNIPLRDSKKLTTKQREKIYHLIIKYCVAYHISAIDNQSIDKNGINQTNAEVIKRCGLNLKPQADYLLIDQIFRIPSVNQPFKIIKQGDVYIGSIAAASILAKVYRDNLMINLSTNYPEYHFEKHKGYGTKLHQAQLKKYGPCPIHRLSYQPIKHLI